MLLYTAIIAPVQIFLWEFNDEECNKFPTLFFDVLVDVFFMTEVVLNFLTGSLDMSETYCDDFRLIAARYMAAPNGFWYDLATSLPWSLNDLLAFQACTANTSPSRVNSEARVLRIAKLLRILKIVRILKAVKVIE